MDQKVEIKEEPVLFEETASASFPSADVKDELIIEERVVDQLVPCLKEENKVEKVVISIKRPTHSNGGCCKALNARAIVMCHLPSRKQAGMFCSTKSNGRDCQMDERSMHILTHSTDTLHKYIDCSSMFPEGSCLKYHPSAQLQPKHCRMGNRRFPKGRFSEHSKAHHEKYFECY
ncbi:uncharacterized protein [Anabrus simplex]|uniref:uncharacterized protein n=1 Tax=Anabrus simplex TaxID=316456 RepID=UPI0034DDA9F3